MRSSLERLSRSFLSQLSRHSSFITCSKEKLLQCGFRGNQKPKDVRKTSAHSCPSCECTSSTRVRACRLTASHTMLHAFSYTKACERVFRAGITYGFNKVNASACGTASLRMTARMQASGMACWMCFFSKALRFVSVR